MSCVLSVCRCKLEEIPSDNPKKHELDRSLHLVHDEWGPEEKVRTRIWHWQRLVLVLI